jgi:hypothetical protein
VEPRDVAEGVEGHAPLYVANPFGRSEPAVAGPAPMVGCAREDVP